MHVKPREYFEHQYTIITETELLQRIIYTTVQTHKL